MPAIPFVPFVNTAQLIARYTLESQPCENVYHFKGTAAWTSTLLAALGSAFKDVENAHFKPLRGGATVFISTMAIDLTSPTAPFDDSTWDIEGTLASEALPNNCSIAVKAITGLRGRSYRGRTYWIGLTQADRSTDDTNQISPAKITAIQTAMRVLLTTTWPNSAVPVVASRKQNKTWLSEGITTPILDYVFTDNVVDSQRRRLPAHNVHH